MGIILYDSNNSGGHWWLSDEDWDALAEAGWNVHWVGGTTGSGRKYDAPLEPVAKTGNTWLGARAMSAAKATDDPEAAIAEFEAITGQCASDIGCTCCGEPHHFEYTDDAGNTKRSSAEVVTTELSWF